MARRPVAAKRLNAANLAGLGAERIAELLMEASDSDPILKRRLRLVMAAEAGPEVLGLELDKRLTTIATSRARVSWRKRPDLLRDLDILRRGIVDDLAPAAPSAGLERMIGWLDLFRGLTTRVKDQKGEVAAAFEDAAPDLWRIAAKAVRTDDSTLEHLAQAVARQPLEYARWIAVADETLTPDLARGLIDHLDAKTDARGMRTVMRRLADRAGDLDLWLSLVSREERGAPDFAAAVAQRLVAAGRIVEAREALEAALTPAASNRLWTFGRSPSAGPPRLTPAWEAASIAVLDAEGRKDEAQTLRWELFQHELSAPVLKDYLARLPDFDDVEALDRALALAAAHADFEKGLGFLMDWPAHREAAAMVEHRRREIHKSLPQRADWAARLAQRFPTSAELLSAG
ncbi:DUF6880 family protein [Brevundimonas nasdae]|uniref:DUF6880 family protein n=1 Tax=Brevundimonas nasdae TaxID=172043 RepID=UPI003F69049E